MEDNHPNNSVVGYPAKFHHGQCTQVSVLPSQQQIQSPYRAVATTATATATATANPVVASPATNYGCHARLRKKLCKIVGGVIFIASCVTILKLLTRNEPYDPRFWVESFSVSSLNVSDSFLSANVDVSLGIRNPFSMPRVLFEQAEASVLYEGNSISRFEIPTLYVYEHTTSLQRGSMRWSIEDSAIARAISAERSSGVVTFAVSTSGVIRIIHGSDAGPIRKLSVLCEDVKVGFNSNATTRGTMLGEEPSVCKVHTRD